MVTGGVYKLIIIRSFLGGFLRFLRRASATRIFPRHYLFLNYENRIDRLNDRLDFFLGLVVRRFSDEMEKVRIGMTDSTFFICREVEIKKVESVIYLQKVGGTNAAVSNLMV